MLADVSYSPTTRTTGVLSVRGTIGLSNARDVCVVMLSLIDNDAVTKLSVDLRDAEFVTAAGALALLAARRYGGSSCSVELVNVSPTARHFIGLLAPHVIETTNSTDLSDLRTQRDKETFDEMVRDLPMADSY
jgi:anti-anti-sigma regulatory factor